MSAFRVETLLAGLKDIQQGLMKYFATFLHQWKYTYCKTTHYYSKTNYRQIARLAHQHTHFFYQFLSKILMDNWQVGFGTDLANVWDHILNLVQISRYGGIIISSNLNVTFHFFWQTSETIGSYFLTLNQCLWVWIASESQLDIELIICQKKSQNKLSKSMTCTISQKVSLEKCMAFRWWTH